MHHFFFFLFCYFSLEIFCSCLYRNMFDDNNNFMCVYVYNVSLIKGKKMFETHSFIEKFWMHIKTSILCSIVIVSSLAVLFGLLSRLCMYVYVSLLECFACGNLIWWCASSHEDIGVKIYNINANIQQNVRCKNMLIFNIETLLMMSMCRQLQQWTTNFTLLKARAILHHISDDASIYWFSSKVIIAQLTDHN